MFDKMLKMPIRFVMDWENVTEICKLLNAIMKRKNREKVLIDCSGTKEIKKHDLILLVALLEKIEVLRRKDNKDNIQISLENLSNNHKNILRTLLKKDTNNRVVHLSTKDVAEEKLNQIKLPKADPRLVGSIVQDLTKININENYDILYDLLMEMVQNTIEHGLKGKHINWWICQNKKDKKNMAYSSFDLGLGILKSYKNAGFFSYFHRMMYSDAFLLEKALKGELGSSTKIEGRGTGLPSINKAIIEQWLDSFVLITNNVYIEYNSSSKEFRSKKIPNFEGTYYSWVINKECFERWKQIKV